MTEEGMMITEEKIKEWRALQEAEIEHIKEEIFKAESYLRCLRQLKDAAILSSFPMSLRVGKEKSGAS
jgi:hypothetical protein